MPYHVYLPLVKNFMQTLPEPVSAIEIGLEKGTTFLDLARFMVSSISQFSLIGVDIRVNEQVTKEINELERSAQQQITLIEQNSLVALPELVMSGQKFDIIMIDGDHNYYTVQKELSYMDSLAHEKTLVLVDDYSGRWKDRDYWYIDGVEHSNKLASKHVETSKIGGNQATDEFVAASAGKWKLSKPLACAAVVLHTSVVEIQANRIYIKP